MSCEPLVIYHANCYDGFTAARIAQEALNHVGHVPELFPAKYGEPPPDVHNRVVYVLDFSYPREVMEDMHAKAAHLQVLDHHKTAAEACDGLSFCEFDMERSGCRMAWDHFNGTHPPDWVLRVEDRDLWRFRFDDTREVHAYIASLPMSTEEWDRLDRTPFSEVVAGGKAIRRYIDTYCEKAAAEARLVGIAGYTAVVVNVPYQNASEMGSVLLEKHPGADFAAGYFQRADGRWQFSLRSRSGFDVSEIAKLYGGGGHAGAAGFDVPTLESVLLEPQP
ncbi:MAG: DHHA1 domain-containing protein [Myxococcota bacterium]